MTEKAVKLDTHKRYIAGTHPTTNPITDVIARPAIGVGRSLIIVSIGVYFFLFFLGSLYERFTTSDISTYLVCLVI